jgi:hypothetical protein
MIAFGLADPVQPEEIRQRVERGTGVFLRAYQPAGTSGADQPAGQPRVNP